MLRVLNQAFDQSMNEEQKAVMPLAGGIMQHGYQCGQIWGAALAAGTRAYHVHGAGPLAECAAVNTSKKIVESFRSLKNSINCIDITEIDKNSSSFQMIMYFLIKGGTIGCIRLASQYAKLAYEAIQNNIENVPVDPPSPPVSCAALLVKKMGGSEKHSIMAAGFAGGIGLSGGACGALGAAIWMNTMKRFQDGKVKMEFDHPEDQAIIDRFMKVSEFEFECFKITGQKFNTVDEHAAFIKQGGCQKIFEELSK